MLKNRRYWLYAAISIAIAIIAIYVIRSINTSDYPFGNDFTSVAPDSLKPWQGDFAEMRKRRVIRFLVPNGKTWYFIDGARERGFVYDYGKEFEKWINKKYNLSKVQMIHVVFVPTNREHLLIGINDGLGDIAAGGITITENRKDAVDFSIPLASDVKEIFVNNPSISIINSIDDLAGKTVVVRKSSSYWEHLEELNKKFKDAGKNEIELIAADENLEDEDILEMVNTGLIPITTTNLFLANYWKQLFTQISVNENLILHDKDDIAWVIRKNSSQLKSEVDEFIKTHAMNSAFQNTLKATYLGKNSPLKNAITQNELKKFNAVINIFKRYAKEYNMDYLMLVAMGYQESKLDQSARNPSGAAGIMQILPKTAAHSPINIKDVDKYAENNIHAGVKYLDFLAKKYVNEPEIDPRNRMLLTFAAYNAGPSNLNKFRRLAKDYGLNPNIWFNHVELAAARVGGQQTVGYIGNVYKYYVAYSLMEAKKDQSNKEKLKQMK